MALRQEATLASAGKAELHVASPPELRSSEAIRHLHTDEEDHQQKQGE